jgi:hypothetical protein
LKLAPRVLSLLLLVVMATFSHCFCPDDVVLGNVSFQNQDIWPFQGEEVFTYVNSNGEEIAFNGSAENAVQNLPIIMERNCTKLHLDWQDTYYDAELLSFEYHLNNSVYLSYYYMVRNAVESPSSHVDTVLYETFDARFVNTSWTVAPATNDFVSVLVSDRGNSLGSVITDSYDDFRIIPDTTLNGIQYQDLICQRNNPGLFYSKTFGVVLFNYDEDWWHLKR